MTGSGKTEIYFHLIDEQLKQKIKRCFIYFQKLQLQLKSFKDYNHILVNELVYHSRLNISERTELWYSMMDENLHQFDIILGARSAVFLPFKNLGLIIVDEEHEAFTSNSIHHQDIMLEM